MQIHLIDVAKQQKTVSGTIVLSALLRLKDSLISQGTAIAQIDDAKVAYVAQGLPPRYFDDAALPMLQLSLTVDLPMVCQRCFAPLPHPVSAIYLYAISEQAPESLLEEDEVEWLSLEDLALDGLIEDELLMAQPISVLHPHACVAETVTSTAKPNPFAVLAQLKNKK